MVLLSLFRKPLVDRKRREVVRSNILPSLLSSPLLISFVCVSRGQRTEKKKNTRFLFLLCWFMKCESDCHFFLWTKTKYKMQSIIFTTNNIDAINKTITSMIRIHRFWFAHSQTSSLKYCVVCMRLLHSLLESDSIGVMRTASNA